MATKFRLAYGPIGGATLGFYAGELQGFVSAEDEGVVTHDTQEAADAAAKSLNEEPFRVTQGHEYRVESFEV